MSENRRTLPSSFSAEIEAGVRTVAAADVFLLEQAISRYRWERRGPVGRLVRTPIAQESSLAEPSLRRAA